MRKSQSGFGAAGIFLIIFIIGISAFAYYRVQQADDQIAESIKITSFDECVAAGNPVMESYPEQCAADGGTFVNPNQTIAKPQPLDPYETKIGEIAFADLPEGLRSAIKTRLQSICSQEELSNSDTLYTYAVANKSEYVEEKYAVTSQTCGSGASAALYAVKDGSWQYVATTQDQWPCDKLVEFSIPDSFIDQCLDEVGEPPISNPVSS